MTFRKPAFVFLSMAFATPASVAAESRSLLECPGVLKTKVVGSEYNGWNIYSNNPSRLTGADISYSCENEECTLDPDETMRLNDDHWSTAQIFRLADHHEAKNPVLICEYGVHAELRREISVHLTQCTITRHARFNDAKEFEFEVVCK